MMGSAMDSTLVQVAVHDAVQAIDRRFEPYHVEIKGAKGSRSAAAEAAAHAVLVGMYPAQVAALDATYFDYLASRGLNDDRTSSAPPFGRSKAASADCR